jgi:hypothetical protein
MFTITSLKDSAFSSMGQWLSSVISKVKGEDDQDEMGSSISLFLIERGQARSLANLGEHDIHSRVMLVRPQGLLVTLTDRSASAICRVAKDELWDEDEAVTCVIASLNDMDWDADNGFHEESGVRTISIHFNYGYRSLSFVSRISSAEDDSMWMIQTDNPPANEFEGWARLLTPMETE